MEHQNTNTVVRGEPTILQVSAKGQIRIYTVESTTRSPSLELRYFRLDSAAGDYVSTTHSVSMPMTFQNIDGLQSAVSSFKLLVDEPDTDAAPVAPVEITAPQVFKSLSNDLIRIVANCLISGDRDELISGVKKIAALLVETGGWDLISKSSFHGSDEYAHVKPMLVAFNSFITKGKIEGLSKVISLSGSMFEDEIAALVEDAEKSATSERAAEEEKAEATRKLNDRISSATVLELFTMLTANGSEKLTAFIARSATAKLDVIAEVNTLIAALIGRQDLNALFKRSTFAATPELFDLYKPLLRALKSAQEQVGTDVKYLPPSTTLEIIEAWKSCVIGAEVEEVVEHVQKLELPEGYNYYAVAREGQPIGKSMLVDAETALSSAHELGQYVFGITVLEGGKIKRTPLLDVNANSGEWQLIGAN